MLQNRPWIECHVRGCHRLLTRLTMSRLDSDYCTQTTSNPLPGDKFSGLKYTNDAKTPPVSVNIKDWIQGIGKADPTLDMLSEFDKSIDGSIGGLGTSMENMFNSQRAAPLIEFRDLQDQKTSDFEQFMSNVDSAIQKLHADFANAPTKIKRDIPDYCKQTHSATSGTSPAIPSPPPPPPPPPVVAPVDPPSQPSCVPSPADSVKDAHAGELEKAAKYFCQQHTKDTITQGPVDVASTIIAGTVIQALGTVDIAYPYQESQGNQDDVYDFHITSVKDCTPPKGFNLAVPLANHNCEAILQSAWQDCKSPRYYY